MTQKDSLNLELMLLAKPEPIKHIETRVLSGHSLKLTDRPYFQKCQAYFYVFDNQQSVLSIHFVR